MNAAKFDVTKMFDPVQALDHAEKHAKNCASFIADTKSREMAQTISTAGFEFARAQVAAGQAFGEAMRKAFQI